MDKLNTFIFFSGIFLLVLGIWVFLHYFGRYDNLLGFLVPVFSVSFGICLVLSGFFNLFELNSRGKELFNKKRID